MKNLKDKCGLEVKLKDNFKLELDISLLGGEFGARTIRDMKEVFKDKVKLSNAPLYFMYRNIRKRAHEEMIAESNIQYDMSVILPGTVGTEYNKTLGHYHPKKEGTDVEYSEVYGVVSGQAIFLLQKQNSNKDELEDVILVSVSEGEKIIMPPGYGHIIINTSNLPLITSNWVGTDFSRDYDQMKEKHGGAYYLIQNPKSKILNSKQYQIAKNPNYKSLPKIKKTAPKELRHFGFVFDRPMYQTGTRNINHLRFLTHPEEFVEELKPESVLDFKN